eukprot:1775854-Prymnesium_polylepis.2
MRHGGRGGLPNHPLPPIGGSLSLTHYSCLVSRLHVPRIPDILVLSCALALRALAPAWDVAALCSRAAFSYSDCTTMGVGYFLPGEFLRGVARYCMPLGPRSWGHRRIVGAQHAVRLAYARNDR